MTAKKETHPVALKFAKLSAIKVLDSSDTRGCLACLSAGQPENRESVTLCSPVIKFLEKVGKWQEEHCHSCLVCCHGVAKLLIARTANEPCVFVCRSPHLDVTHAEDVAKEWGKTLGEFVTEWRGLPKFGPALVHSVIGAVSAQLSREMQQSLKELGKGYRDFEFDVVVYRVLTALRNLQAVQKGVLEIRCASVPRDVKHKPIVRLIVEHLGSDQPRFALPIVGLAVETAEADQLVNSLDLATVQTLSKALLPEQPDMAKQTQSFNNSRWHARCECYFAPDTGDGWVESARRIIEMGCHLGFATVGHALQQKLECEGWGGFKDLLLQFSGSEIHPVVLEERAITDEDRRTNNRKRETVARRVLSDLASAASELAGETSPDREQLRNNALRELLVALDRYSPLTEAPQIDDMTSLRSLSADLRTGQARYATMVRRMLLPSWLDQYSYTDAAIREALELDLDSTVDALLRATERERIKLDSEPGKSAWRAVLDFSRAHVPEKELTAIKSELFDLTAPRHWRVPVGALADTLGALCAVVTLGIVLPDSIISDIRRVACRHYFQRRLGFRK